MPRSAAVPRGNGRSNHCLTVVSANVRGLRTNIGDLSHNFVLRHRADVVAVTETWLSCEVEPTFGKIPGYSQWVRKDRENRAGGGVAACFKDGLQTQKLDIELPHQLEALFFRVVLTDNSGLLLCVMYRPPRQGRAPLDFLTNELDSLLLRHQCSQVMVVGDLNFHLEQEAFDNLLTVQGLINHVTFPTHERGGILDPVLSDLPDTSIQCQQLGPVGSSDHYTVLAQVKLQTAREEAVSRTIWLWERADWSSMRQAMENTDWEALLVGNTETKASALTTKLLALQQQHVPCRVYLTRPGDPAWFGFRCRVAAEAKHGAWLRYKRHPTDRNKTLHREACKRMTATCRWARTQQNEDTKRKLCGPGVGNKTWWSLVKERQGTNHRDSVPPLTRPDGSTATNSGDKASLLSEVFSTKMKVGDPARPAPTLPLETDSTVTSVLVTAGQVEKLLRAVDVGKATGPDDVSPRILKHCAKELSGPLTTVFKSCLRERQWPSIWKKARVVPVHKKGSRSAPTNYRPISLLSVVGKVLEQIVAGVICQHLSENHLLSDKQFGFRPGRSTADLLLLLSKDWQDALDGGLDSLVVALDIAGAFDRVWHAGLIEKLRAKGIQGDLLVLLKDYLQGRTLQVVINGQTSGPSPVEASVPQGSVLGPILWNIYIDDLLQQLTTVAAYADDCTLSRTYCRPDSQRAVRELNRQLRLVEQWGEMWQVSFAPEKTQAMVISRSPGASQAVSGQLCFGGKSLPLQEHIKILGVTVDRGLRFNHHVTAVARQASLRVSALRRVAGSLNPRGILTLYRAQIRPYLEYGALSWMSSAATHMQRLDAVERRALRLAEAGDHLEEQLPSPPVTSLEHRRDVGALVVCHKTQVQRVSHLGRLRLPPRTTQRCTRTTSLSDQHVEVPRSQTRQHQRTYTARSSRLWNMFTAATPQVLNMSTHQVKLAAHNWRKTLPTPLVLQTQRQSETYSVKYVTMYFSLYSPGKCFCFYVCKSYVHVCFFFM